MNPEIKSKWLAALRSGEYKQGKGQLRKEDNFCCLGVLCDLHAKETEQKWEVDYVGGNYLNHCGNLPLAVRDWAGLGSANPKIEGDWLSNYNDNEPGKSFAEIADLIEKHL